MKLFAAVILALPLAAQPGPPAASVEGIVVNSVTGLGIDGAKVHVEDREALTGVDGTFKLAGLTPGSYRVFVEKSGFPGGFPQTVQIQSQAETARLRFELNPPGTLRGRVFGTDGKPAAGVKVDTLGQDAVTNEDGAFVFENLLPFSYVLKAFPPADSRPVVREGTRTALVPTYFPAAVDRSLAAEIKVLPGADQGGYDIYLQTAPVARIRGLVVDTAGQPVADAAVELLARYVNPRTGPFISIPSPALSFGLIAGSAVGESSSGAPITTDDEGAFEFPSVREGDWTLFAYDPLHGTRALRASMPISVARRDIDNVRLQLAESFDLKGIVTLDDGSQPPVKISGFVNLEPEIGIGGVLGKIGPDNTFELNSIALGRYRVRPTSLSAGNYYVSSVLLGDAEAGSQYVDLSPSTPTVRIILKPGAAVRGTVEKGEGATVVLWPADFSTGDFGGYLKCGAGGAFEFTGLGPGVYYAIALERFAVAESARAEQLRAMAEKATRVRVEEASTVSVQLNLTRGLR